jgi:hypothetical protein
MPQVAQGWKVEYILFSRLGFTEAAKAEAEALGARLLTLVEMEKTLAAANR